MASKVLRVGMIVLCGLWLHSIITTSLLSPIPPVSFPVFTRFAILFAGDLPLSSCVLDIKLGFTLGRRYPGPTTVVGSSVGVLRGGCPSLETCLRVGTKWYGWRESYANFTLLSSVFLTGHLLFQASCAPAQVAHFLADTLSALLGQSLELCCSAQ